MGHGIAAGFTGQIGPAVPLKWVRVPGVVLEAMTGRTQATKASGFSKIRYSNGFTGQARALQKLVE